MAAKGKYQEWLTDEGLLLVEGWARDGLTDKQIAHNMGVTEQTLNVWKNKYPSLFESLKKGKEVIDRQVENALLKRALGYTYEEVTHEESEDGYKIKRTVKEVVPDVTAQIFWLKNRQYSKWSNKENVDAKKVEAETELIQEKTKLLKGASKDTSLLDALIDVVKEND